VVAKTEGVRLLRANEWRWGTLRAETKLRAGDLLYVPLRGTLQLQAGKLTFGSQALATEAIEGIRGHVLAITGQSGARLLDLPTKQGALSPAQLRKEVEAGRVESQAFTQKEWDRAIGYGARPESRLTPSLEEVQQINKNFDTLHFRPERGLTPDGRDQREPDQLDRAKRVDHFRATLQIGDDTHCGLALEVKPPIAKIQTPIGERWMKIEQLVPPGERRCEVRQGVSSERR
jgi:hypothetical protein